MIQKKQYPKKETEWVSIIRVQARPEFGSLWDRAVQSDGFGCIERLTILAITGESRSKHSFSNCVGMGSRSQLLSAAVLMIDVITLSGITSKPHK